MPRVNQVAEIMVDADTLWKAVGEFGTAARWHPQVSDVTVIDGPNGRTRLVQFKTGGEQLERLEAEDRRQRVYRYSIERTSLPVRDYTGELRVEATDTYRSRLVWEAQFTLADEGDDRAVEAVRQFLHDGAARIQAEYRPYANEDRGTVNAGIADQDKKTRTGSVNEPVRNTPPAGAWNDTSSD